MAFAAVDAAVAAAVAAASGEAADEEAVGDFFLGDIVEEGLLPVDPALLGSPSTSSDESGDLFARKDRSAAPGKSAV